MNSFQSDRRRQRSASQSLNSPATFAPAPPVAEHGTLAGQSIAGAGYSLADFSIHSPAPQPTAMQLQQSERTDSQEQSGQLEQAPEGRRENQTGLPDTLKAGVERLSGYSLDNIRVHYNSPAPSEVQALAYTQGTEIHVGPGQEQHLAHEAWHVVQQMQGRVQPTMQMKGVAINDDEGLEREAEQNGTIVAHRASDDEGKIGQNLSDHDRATGQGESVATGPVQMVKSTDITNVHQTQGTQDYYSIPKGSSPDTSKPISAVGFGATTKDGKPLKTSIEWGPVDSTSGEGTQVEAKQLGPDHRLGSSPDNKNVSNIWTQRTIAFKDSFKPETFIAGHLLNAQLGGPGTDARNLTCISSSANSDIKDKIEDKIRPAVNEKFQWVHFKAVVTYSALANLAVHPANKTIKFTNYASQIAFEWGPIDSDGNPTGDTITWTLSIPDPSTNSSAAKIAPVVTSTGIIVPQAETERALDDLILTEWLDVKGQMDWIERLNPVISSHIQKVDDLQKELAEKDIKAKEQEGNIQKQEDEIKGLKAELEKEKDNREKAEKERDVAKAKQTEQEDEIAELKRQIAELKAERDGLSKLTGFLEVKRKKADTEQPAETPVTSMTTGYTG